MSKRVIISTLAGLVALVVVATTALLLLRPRDADGSGDSAGAAPARLTVPGAVLPASAGAVLPPVGADAPEPTAAALARTLRPLLRNAALGKSLSVDVLDPETGEHLVTRSQTTARTPASTQKLLTSAAALTALGPDATLATRAVSAGRGRVVLVGGGDVLLGAGKSDPEEVNGRAGLATLAARTATALKAEGTTTVSLRLDDRLFTGPAKAPGWSPGDVASGFVAPVQALEINAGRLRNEDYAPRAGDPAMAAARSFATALGRAGITVGGAPKRGGAPKDAPVLAEVASAPVGDQVEFALTHSDNTVAEALGRLVAVRTGREPSFAQVGAAVLAEVKKLGVTVTGARMADASGLADGSRVAPVTLTAVLAAAAGDDHPGLRPVLSGMPVAGVSGTLLERFGGSKQKAAAGVVRAKTGTLTGVSALAGTVVDADGRLLVFAAMADHVGATLPARTALDALATQLANCGCR